MAASVRFAAGSGIAPPPVAVAAGRAVGIAGAGEVRQGGGLSSVASPSGVASKAAADVVVSCDVSPSLTTRDTFDDGGPFVFIPFSAPGLPVGHSYTWREGSQESNSDPSDEERDRTVAEMRKFLLEHSNGYRHLHTDPTEALEGEVGRGGVGALQGCSEGLGCAQQGGGGTFRDLFCDTHCDRGATYCGRGGMDSFLAKEVLVVPAGGDYAYHGQNNNAPAGPRATVAALFAGQTGKLKEEKYDGDEVRADEMYLVHTNPDGRATWKPAF